jgi:hypothetical protein
MPDGMLSALVSKRSPTVSLGKTRRAMFCASDILEIAVCGGIH